MSSTIIDLQDPKDRSFLMDLYQLKTLTPIDYKQDTIESNIKVDLSTEDLSKIPKDIVNNLLGDHSDNATQNNTIKDKKTQSLGSHHSNYADALGFYPNILDELINKDILDDSRDPQLNKYMVDSKMFDPRLFLSNIHNDKSLHDLMKGIQFLENDIESKKPLLQQLISANFEKTLSSKNSLDKVFTEFSRSNLGSEITVLDANLASSNNSANQLLNPVLLLNSKEKELSNALIFIEKNKLLLDLPKKLKLYIEEDDIDSVLQEYERGFKIFSSLKKSNNKNPIFDKLWTEVMRLVNKYKETMINELKKVRIELISKNFKSQINSKSNNFVTLIKKIIELDPDSNPIKEFIHFQYEYIYKDLDKGLASINYHRLFNARNSILNAYDANLENGDSNSQLSNITLKRVFSLFSSPNFDSHQFDKSSEKVDSIPVIQLWTFVVNYVSDVSEEVMSKKILKFEDIVEFFIKDFDKILSAKAKATSSNLKICDNDLNEMKKYFSSLVSKICDRLDFVFACTTSDLTNALIKGKAEGTKVEFPPVGKKDLNNIETFGYIPPKSNSVSTLCYSLELHDMIFKKLSEFQNKTLVLTSQDSNETIQNTLKSVNKNIILGCLTVLSTDIKKILYVDNMTPSETVQGATKLVTFLMNYYQFCITKISQLYIFEDEEIKNIITKQFLSSFDLLLKSMIKNVARFCEIDPLRADYHYLATMYNMRNMYEKIVPVVLKSYDLSFKTKLSKQKDLDIYKNLSRYEMELFKEYMSDHIKIIKQIVNDAVSYYKLNSHGILNRVASEETIDVSPYILKAINHINKLRLKLSNLKVRTSYILDVQQSLMSQLEKKIFDNVSNLAVDDDMRYQIVLDLHILLFLFKSYNSNKNKNIFIDTKYLDDAISKLKTNVDLKSIEKNCKANIQFNSAQFKCFITE